MFTVRSIISKALVRYSYRVSSHPVMWGDDLFNSLGVSCNTIHPSRVHGVCTTPIKTRGYVSLKVNIGKSSLKHRFMILKSAEPTIIFGRDFLRRFNSTEFDWRITASD